MDMLQDLTDDWGLCKCGEITTLLSIGRKEFFLSCELCDYRIQNLDLFIKHVYQCHLQEFTQANSRPASTEFFAQNFDEEIRCDVDDEEVDNKDFAMKGFERVVIDMDESGMENSVEFKIGVEPISGEYTVTEYDEEETLNDAEFLEEDAEYSIENNVENSSKLNEFHGLKEEKQNLIDDERKFILEFIKLYRALPGLWNVKNKYYHNKDIKSEQYNTLLKKYREMYPSAVLRDVKKKINALRTNYNRERRMLQTTKTKSNLYYYNEISFLQDNESHSESKAEGDESDHLEMSYDDRQSAGYLEEVKQQKQSRKRASASKESARQQFNLEFIELYKSLPSLWDPNALGYKDQELRNINYKVLLQKYRERHPNAVLLDVRKKINSMRTNYNHELKRYEKTGVESKSYYFEAMSFLRNKESTKTESTETEKDSHDMEICFEAEEEALSEEYLEGCYISEQESIEETEFENTQSSFTHNIIVEKKNASKFIDEDKFILELLELYKTMPSIWDSNSPDYYDQELKAINYEILLEKYKENHPSAALQDLKVKLNILRTNFNRESKRLANREIKQSKLFYFGAMNFLQNEKSDEVVAADTPFMVQDVTVSHTKFKNKQTTQKEGEKKTLFEDKQTTQRVRVETFANEQKFLLEFIDLYRSLPALWDTSLQDYSDIEVRNINYQILHEKYKEWNPNAEISEVKKKINNLRTNYRRDLKKGPPYKSAYFHKMSFISQISAPASKGDTQSEEDLKANNISVDETPTQFEFTDNKVEEREFLIDFIEMYRKFPALWNIHSGDYTNRDLRNAQYLTLLEKYKEMYPTADLDDMKSKISILRGSVRRELKNGPPYKLFYFDSMKFLIDMQVFSEIKLKPPTSIQRKDSSLDDEEFIHLAKAYESYPNLWNLNEISYHFSNRRRDSMNKLLEKFNKISGLNLTKDVLDKEISELRKICSKEKKRKIFCKQKKLSYESQFQFYEHISFLEDYINPFECIVCEEILIGSRKYQIHLASHDGSLPFKCNICEHGFKNAANLTVHLRRHTRDFVFSCKLCHESFITSTNLKHHMLKHTGDKPHVCHVCGMGFRDARKFKYHVQRHDQIRRYRCQICTKAFYTARYLRTHHAAVHVKVRSFICDVCNKGFTTPKHLRQHKHIHNVVKRFVCKFCEKRYAQGPALYCHVKSAHGLMASTITNGL